MTWKNTPGTADKGIFSAKPPRVSSEKRRKALVESVPIREHAPESFTGHWNKIFTLVFASYGKSRMNLSLPFIPRARHLLPFLASAVCVTRPWLRGVRAKWWEIEMNPNSDELLRKTSFCRTHDQLLARYQRAMELWATCRDDTWRMGLPGNELTGELFRLQTDFANAYAALHKHRRKCALCACVREGAQREATPAWSADSQHAQFE
jgi:hypothetical protein